MLVPEGEVVLDLEVKREKFFSLSRQNEQHERRTRLEAGTDMVCWEYREREYYGWIKLLYKEKEEVSLLFNSSLCSL